MNSFHKKKLQSLSKLALKKLENNPDLIIKRMKNVPYFMIKSVVKRCTPEQLLKLEKYNKSYKSETQELWKFHCKNKFSDIRAEDDEGKLEDVEDWRDLYWARQRTEEARLQRIKEKMKLSYSKLEKTKQKKSLIVADIKPNRMKMLSSSSRSSVTSSGSTKLKRNASLMQKAKLIAKRTSSHYDIPIQNHSFSNSSGIRASPISSYQQPIKRKREEISRNSNLQRMSNSNRSSSSSSSRTSNGRSLNSLKSKMSSQNPSASDIIKKRPHSNISSNHQNEKEKKIKSSSWDASSSFFSKF